MLVASLCVWASLLIADDETVMAYERARTLLPGNLKGLVRNESVQAHWFGSQHSFWYERDSNTGSEYIVVDALNGEKRIAFDQQRLAKSVGELPGSANSVPLNPDTLMVTSMELKDAGLELVLSIGPNTVTCVTTDYSCVESAASHPAMDLLLAPNGETGAFVRENNLWLRLLETGEEQQLTSDGEKYFGYGIRAEQNRFHEVRTGTVFPFPPSSTYWSPDGSKLIVQRLDERRVLAYPFVEMVPQNGGFRPASYAVRIPLLGDSNDRITESFILNVKTGKQSPVKLPQGFGLDYFVVSNTPIAWGESGKNAFMLTANAGAKTVQLVELSLESGETRVLIEEQEKTSVTLNHGGINPNVRILNKDSEAVWFSERSGWGHLYLYDLSSGKLKNAITSGDWLVWDIVHIDEERRQVFFTAGGKELGRDPYYRHLYKASLDGGDITLLTPENADHDIKTEFSGLLQYQLPGTDGGSTGNNGGGFFIDTYSTVDTAPVTVLRSLKDGHLVSRLEQADATALYAAGWKAPERFSVKSADGLSDIQGVMYLPSDFDAEKSYPVIDAIYGGPVSLVASRSFKDAYSNGYFPASVAELGFAVVLIDGRGTPHRSRTFREAGYGSFADPQLDDHVAALQQLADRYSYLDIDKVGVYGHSNGGYLSARALLKHPEFFKVGFASAGPQNFQGLPGTGTPWFGVPDYGEGVALRPEINAIPENYRIMDNATFANQLQGRLMLVCGELDYTAFPALTMQLAAALIKANKNFDTLYLPGSTHRYFVDDLYVTRRLWDYFIEYLAGQTPPSDFNMNHSLSQ